MAKRYDTLMKFLFNLRVKTFNLLLFACVLDLNACAIKSNGPLIVQQVKSEQELSLPAVKQMQEYLKNQPFETEAAQRWWLSFADPVLQQLVDVALEQAYQVRTALANLEAAKSQLRASNADLLPSVELGIDASVTDFDVERNDFAGDTLSHRFGVSALMQWQVDVSGRARSLVASSRADVVSTAALLRDVQRLVVQQVVGTYVELRAAQQRLLLAQQSVQRREQHVERIERLLQKGYATALDKSRTDNQLYESKADAYVQEIEMVRLTNALALLLGLNLIETRALVHEPRQLPVLVDDVPLPNVSQLIHHRPDIRAVELRLLAVAFELNAAKASLYPSFSVGVNVFKQGERLGKWPDLSDVVGRVFSNLAVPILGRGRLLAAVDSQSARLKEAHISYEETIARALAELDSSVVSVVKTRQIYEQRKLAAESAKVAAESSYALFQSGEIDYTSVIVAEQTRTFAEQAAIVAHRTAVVTYVGYLSAVVPVW